MLPFANDLCMDILINKNYFYLLLFGIIDDLISFFLFFIAIFDQLFIHPLKLKKNLNSINNLMIMNQ